MIEVVFSSRVSLLAFYFQESFTAHKMVLWLKRRIKLVKKYSLMKKKRVLIQLGERRRNLLTNKSNEQSEKYSPLWKCSKLFIPPQTNGIIHFFFNIGCSESKVVFSSDEKQKPHKSKRAFREANVCISFSLSQNSLSDKQTQSNTFSSPEPLGLICNRPVAEPLVSLPRDQETTGSGDENESNTVNTQKKPALSLR